MNNSVQWPAISIIIPTYNRGRFLPRAIASINNQTYPGDIEIIIVDDGSTDDTRERVSAWPDVVYHYTNNGGPSGARNQGLKLANSDFIAFLDSDDQLVPEALIQLMEAMLAGKAVDIVMGHVLPVDIDGKPASDTRTGAYLGAGLYKRGVFSAVGDFDESKHSWEDLDWLAKAAETGFVRQMIDETTLMYTVHDGNMSADRDASNKGLLAVLRESLLRREQ